ncbi:MAG: Uma2 family endonuclease [Cyanobacteria bacterium J06560_6]
MVQAPTKPLTLDGFLALPETKPASEFINGRIIQKPMPQGKHSRLQLDFAALINTAVRPQKIACPFTELRCIFGGSSVVPDIVVMQWQHVPVDANGQVANVFDLAPDWTIEILSPDQRVAKVTRKILHCLEHGTEMGWLINPEDGSVFVHRSQQAVEVYDEESEASLPMPSFIDGLSITTKELFDLLIF